MQEDWQLPKNLLPKNEHENYTEDYLEGHWKDKPWESPKPFMKTVIYAYTKFSDAYLSKNMRENQKYSLKFLQSRDNLTEEFKNEFSQKRLAELDTLIIRWIELVRLTMTNISENDFELKYRQYFLDFPDPPKEENATHQTTNDPTDPEYQARLALYANPPFRWKQEDINKLFGIEENE